MGRASPSPAEHATQSGTSKSATASPPSSTSPSGRVRSGRGTGSGAGDEETGVGGDDKNGGNIWGVKIGDESVVEEDEEAVTRSPAASAAVASAGLSSTMLLGVGCRV
jgi:hypothetical protein